jgi:glutamate synthase (NADPH/NADH) small chain
MSEHHPAGYLKHKRQPIANREPRQRVQDYQHIYAPEWGERQLRQQGERCMDCGVPTCMSGCPLGNIIPDWNDYVQRGLWRQALQALHATNNFPEFTGYTCPAPCESSCVLAYNDDAVTIKNIERAIVDRAWQQGWIVPQPPVTRTEYRVAVIGSGPAGLAAAQQLNRAGHRVTVFEQDDAIGGLMRYGIPDFKFAKQQVLRRVQQLQQEGIVFVTGVTVGEHMTLARLQQDFHALCLTIGAQRPRDIDIPGRQLDGVVLAMDYLVAENRRQAGKPFDVSMDAADQHVVVLGGGDTGADCVATAHRQGARSVTQCSIRDRAAEQRGAHNPWPQPARIYRKTYALEEGGSEAFNFNATAIVDHNGDAHLDSIQMERVRWSYDRDGRRLEKTVMENDIEIIADRVIIATGFSGINNGGLEQLALTERGTIQVDSNMMTGQPGLFAAGDAVMGPSIVVWAIAQGREVARHIDHYLTGSSDLPASINTHNPQIQR